MRRIDDFIAQNRFGLGAAPDLDPGPGDDPRGWVLQQIKPLADIGQGLRGSPEILKGIHIARLESPQALRNETQAGYRKDFAPAVNRRARLAITTDASFAERMAGFWSNHFTVSNTKKILGPALPAYEREAIRPHVFGRFSDMLRAAVRHPVMLSYLDNIMSAGENSRVGKRRMQRSGGSKTLNENLAREILELHTLGVNGGYAQDDVLELARALSGWTFGGVRLGPGAKPVTGGFEFRRVFHEPGARVIMGQRFAEDGEGQGLAILDMLAMHPSTARHLATKLVRHLVSDDPPPEAVDRIAQVYLDTGGDLAEVSRALVMLDAAWTDPLAKVKTHYEFVIAVHRATGNRAMRQRDLAQPLRALGQMPFTAPSPAGWGDRATDWIAPAALKTRIEWVRGFAARQTLARAPSELLLELIGPVAAESTGLWVDRAPSPDSALALILASAEFQRR